MKASSVVAQTEAIRKIYVDFIENRAISDDEALDRLSLIAFPASEMSFVKRIQAEIESNRRSPSGGDWLQKLVGSVEYLYRNYLITFEKRADEFSFRDFVEHGLADDKSGVARDYEQIVDDKDQFWDVVDKISQALS